MFNYFHYRGVCSLDLGVLVSDAEPWTTKVTPETVTIPGRGDALLGYEYSNSDAVYNIIIRKTGRDTLTDASSVCAAGYCPTLIIHRYATAITPAIIAAHISPAGSP